MKVEVRDMFEPDGTRVQLFDILNEIETNDLNWSILYFYGMGQAPDGLSMVTFEKMVRSDNTGYKMTWDELLAFSKELELTIDCVIVAVKKGAEFDGLKLSQEDFSGCEFFIEAFDSTEWTIKKAE